MQSVHEEGEDDGAGACRIEAVEKGRARSATKQKER